MATKKKTTKAAPVKDYTGMKTVQLTMKSKAKKARKDGKAEHVRMFKKAERRLRRKLRGMPKPVAATPAEGAATATPAAG